MKQAILAAVLAGLVAGMVGAGVVGGLMATKSEGAKGDEVASLDPVADTGLDALQTKVAKLERENAELRDRVDSLELRPVAAHRDPAPLSAAGLSPEDAEEERALLATLDDPAAPIPPALREAFEQTYRDIREQEAQERQREREQREAERISDRVKELAPELGLDQFQVGKMTDVLVNESVERNRMFSEMREGGGDFGDARQMMRDLRQQTTDALAQILTPMQLEQYQEQQNDRWGGFGGPGGGGRGGDNNNDDGGGRRGRGGDDANG